MSLSKKYFWFSNNCIIGKDMLIRIKLLRFVNENKFILKFSVHIFATTIYKTYRQKLLKLVLKEERNKKYIGFAENLLNFRN